MSILGRSCQNWPASPFPSKWEFHQHKTNHQDQSNPKDYAQRRWFFFFLLSKTSWKKPVSLPKCLVRPASSDFWKAPLYSTNSNGTTELEQPLRATVNWSNLFTHIERRAWAVGQASGFGSVNPSPHSWISTFLYIRMLFIRPRLNDLIFLSILGWK